ncbi:hypothetical protein BCR32DRAFT_245433 [Anaeromyces robustus]|uniref:Signal peptidase complex subunit 2 n=1 Tax=Anaeromyces robustus TaxID=1754192 RepID=A0A1Y1X4E0_9FUNG|nr:hypothetical protein BCR32DRAFT_245433 [Anaeromyces robustus]|eukprot:ORX80681.1 hypothetical protein BCR32DRAFT_245433 [Anaeromyces robustus]
MEEKKNAFFESVKDLKIKKYSNVDVQYAVENAIGKLFTKYYGYTEDHKHSNIYLALGYTASLIAGAASLYSYLNPFEKCKGILVVSVSLYFILCGIMTIYNKYVKKNEIFNGNKKDEKDIKSVTVSSKNEKYSDIVEITIELKEGTKLTKKSLKKSYGSWFDEEGNFVPSAFLKDIENILEKKQ